jgi:hypothetical protein
MDINITDELYNFKKDVLTILLNCGAFYIILKALYQGKTGY